MLVVNSWEGVSLHAKRVGAKFPELVASQWALESGFGKHLSGKHNYFGLKGAGSSRETKEFYDGQWVTIKAGFIDFPSLAACIEYLVTRWYKDYKQFRGVNNAPDCYAAARMLKDQGYATDPTYPAKLNKLMKQHSPSSSIRLASAAKFYKEESHQLAAWNWLQEQLTETELEEFAGLYRAAPALKPSNPLMVTYFSQRDNASGQGNRECFSSSCAMVAAYYGKVKGDDEYNVIRARFGDTTNADAQVKALQSLGLKASFITDGTEALLQNEIKEGWLPRWRVNGTGGWAILVRK
jgi:hypothetical protein